MKGKLLITILAALLVAALVGCSSPATPTTTAAPATTTAATTAAPVTIKLSLAHFWPASHFVNTEQIPNWIKDIKAATNNRVEITVHPGETLLKSAEIYDGVVKGIADIGISALAYTRGRFPLFEAWELPGVPYKSAEAAAMVAMDGYNQFKPAELSDTKIMYLFTTGPGHIWTKKRVDSLETIKGLRIRATGLSADSLKALGAVPVAMSQAEATEALMKGVVDGNLSPLETLLGFKQADYVTSLTMTPFIYNTVFFVTMNQSKWQALPADIQQAISNVNAQWAQKAGQTWDAHMQEGYDYGVKDNKMQVINLTAAETAKWKALLAPLQENYITNMSAKNLPGKATLEGVMKIAEKYSPAATK